MRGLELVEGDGTPASAATDTLLESLKEHGVLAGKTGPGRNVLTLMPPLVITAEQVSDLLTTLDIAFADLMTQRSMAA